MARKPPETLQESKDRLLETIPPVLEAIEGYMMFTKDPITLEMLGKVVIAGRELTDQLSTH